MSKDDLSQTQAEQAERANQYKCKCGTIMVGAVSEAESDVCPRCGDVMQPFFEGADLDEKRSCCPRCKSTYPFDRSIQECHICQAYMDTYAPLKKQDKGDPLPY